MTTTTLKKKESYSSIHSNTYYWGYYIDVNDDTFDGSKIYSRREVSYMANWDCADKRNVYTRGSDYTLPTDLNPVFTNVPSGGFTYNDNYWEFVIALNKNLAISTVEIAQNASCKDYCFTSPDGNEVEGDYRLDIETKSVRIYGCRRAGYLMAYSA